MADRDRDDSRRRSSILVSVYVQLFFLAALFTYGDFWDAVFFTAFVVLVWLQFLIVLIPFIGIVFWILIIWVWEWPQNMISVLSLPQDNLFAWALWIPAIIMLIGGIFTTIGTLALVTGRGDMLSLSRGPERRSQRCINVFGIDACIGTKDGEILDEIGDALEPTGLVYRG